MPTETKLDETILEAALTGLQAQRERIVEQIAQIRDMLGQRSGQTVPTAKDGIPKRKRRRRMSAAGRARIAEAQRKRWEALRREQGTTPRKKPGKATAASKPTSEAQPRKRRMSPEGRRRIIEATKKRWAAFRAAQRKAAKGK